MSLKGQKRCFGDILGGSFKLKPSVSLHVHLEVEFSGSQSRSQDPQLRFQDFNSSPYQLRDVLQGPKGCFGDFGWVPKNLMYHFMFTWTWNIFLRSQSKF
jgi:hypothetical protein